MPIFKERLKEIVELVELVPEQFKNQCFELLLKEAIEASRVVRVPSGEEGNGLDRNKAAVADIEGAGDGEEKRSSGGHSGSQAEIVNSDLHLKTRRFMERNGIDIARINELFYKEDGEIKPLVEDYGSTKMAQCQIRIALFRALKNALPTGEFVTSVEAVKLECVDRKTFDGPNWSKNFKQNATLFDFEDFSRDVVELRLTEDGKQELANIISQLG